MRLTPDDWDNFWRECPYCGARYHASDGGCTCLEEVECPECGGTDFVPDDRGQVKCTKCKHVWLPWRLLGEY